MLGSQSKDNFHSMDHTRVQCLKLFILKGVAERIKDPSKIYNSKTLKGLELKVNLTHLNLKKLEFTEGFTAGEILEIFEFVEALKGEFKDDKKFAFMASVLSAFQASLSLDQLTTLNVTLPALKEYFLLTPEECKRIEREFMVEKAISEMKVIFLNFGIDLKDNTKETIKAAYKSLALLAHPDKLKDDPEKDNKVALFKSFQEAYNIYLDKASENPDAYDKLGMNWFLHYIFTHCNKALAKLNSEIKSKGRNVSDEEATKYKVRFDTISKNIQTLGNLVNDETTDTIEYTRNLLTSGVNRERLRVALTYFRMGTFATSMTFMGWHGCALSFTSLCVIAPNVYRFHQYMRRSHFKHNVTDSLYNEGLPNRTCYGFSTISTGILLALSFFRFGIKSPMLIEPALISFYAIYTCVKYGTNFIGLGDFAAGGDDKSYLFNPTPACRTNDPFPHFRYWGNPSKLIKPIAKYIFPLVSILTTSLAFSEMAGCDSSKIGNILPFISVNPLLSAAMLTVSPLLSIGGCTVFGTGFHWFTSIGSQLCMGAKVMKEVMEETRAVAEANKWLASTAANYCYLPDKKLFEDAGLFNLSAAPLSTKIIGLEIAAAALLIGAVYVFAKQYKKSDEVIRAVVTPQ